MVCMSINSRHSQHRGTSAIYIQIFVYRAIQLYTATSTIPGILNHAEVCAEASQGFRRLFTLILTVSVNNLGHEKLKTKFTTKLFQPCESPETE